MEREEQQAAVENERNGSAIRRALEQTGRSVHLLGIGGVGMAGLAVQLAARGLEVSGCDTTSGPLTDWLKERGLSVVIGHDTSHIYKELAFVIRSTAVSREDPECRRARELGVPLFQRGAVLAACLKNRHSIAVSGTHGKTTTTSMITQILRSAGRAPDFCIGGIIDVLGGVAAVDGGETLVVEADESDGTVSLYEPDIAVVTNIEYDHMEHFASRAQMEKCFVQFAQQTRDRVIYCADDPVCRDLLGGLANARGYGEAEDAICRGVDWHVNAFSSECSVVYRNTACGTLRLPVGGRQNALDALGACAAALEAGCSFSEVTKGLATYRPARRRFEKICEQDGVTVISDYCHHPSEIRYVIAMARKMCPRKIVAVYQPHRYTRTLALGAEFPAAFEGVDDLILTPVYAASEAPIDGGRTEDLMAHFEKQQAEYVHQVDGLKEAWTQARKWVCEGDLLLILGAGDVDVLCEWARETWTAE